MEKRRLGKTGPLVSALGLGCMSMSMAYGVRNDEESMRTLHRALDLGVNFFDTADMYGNGHNEEIIGKAIKGKREKIILATKFGFRGKSDDDNYEIDGSPAYIKKACDASLQRLNTDVIDLYYMHRGDKRIPVEDSIGAMADLVKAGKIRYIGISELKAETIRRAAKIHPIAALQTEYSLWYRKPEEKIIPTCRELGIAFVPYSPLGRGFLAGKPLNPETFEETDFRRVLPRFQGENFIANQKITATLKQLADAKKCTPAQLALAWLLAQGNDIVPIPGTKKVSYLEENLGALAIKLTAEDLQHLNSALPMEIAQGARFPEPIENLEM